jgi:hypothetical protein
VLQGNGRKEEAGLHPDADGGRRLGAPGREGLHQAGGGEAVAGGTVRVEVGLDVYGERLAGAGVHEERRLGQGGEVARFVFPPPETQPARPSVTPAVGGAGAHETGVEEAAHAHRGLLAGGAAGGEARAQRQDERSCFRPGGPHPLE